MSHGGVTGRADLDGGLRGWLVPRHRPVRRHVQLQVGVVAQNAGTAFLVHSSLGNLPWDVLHEGLAVSTGLLSLGGWMVVAGTAMLLLWIPLRVRPGVGTVVGTLTAGLWADLFLRVLQVPGPLSVQCLYGVTGILLHGVGTAVYLGAGLGSGPRDGVMTGVVDRFGGSVGVVRTSMEALAVIVGWFIGGTLGVMTFVYAITVGWIVHLVLPAVRVTR